MTPTRFTLRQIMIATGVLGVLLGFGLRSPDILLSLACPAMAVAAAYLSIRFVVRMPLKIRLAIEFATLLWLLVISTLIWNPDFYSGEGQRCENLARRASKATVANPATRLALDREAAWFTRKAWELRRRGLWLGLTMGPCTQDDVKMARMNEVYEFGVLESSEKHEKTVERLLSGGQSDEESDTIGAN